MFLKTIKMKYLINRIAGKTLFTLAFLAAIFGPLTVLSQENGNLETNTPIVRIVSSDENNNYYSLDLNQMPGFFEKAYLLDLIFSDSKMVIGKTILSEPTLEVFSSKVNDSKEIMECLGSYQLKALQGRKNA
ncbi:MAG: hypothetical protein IPH45_21405 [Bacteroidales bacterium]|nr:hypothetical protein [Bacteroidales bacterium]